MKPGYLLINLGTPRSPSVRDVRQYLNEFLMDPYVLDAPWPVRRLIVSAFILPFRPRKSAAAYASIWTQNGSPLLHHSQALCSRLEREIGEPVALAMRYGEPSIQNSIRTLYEAGADHIVIVPLYPQFADSTVTTSVAAARKAIGNSSPSSVVAPFYAEDQHINALRESIREHLPARYDHVLFSYHGLPERHITQSDPTGKHCLQSVDCCVTESSAHATCYRHQALTTASLVAGGLELSPDQYSISFQSRLGRLPWLTPYTDQVLRELPERGIKHLVVACPAFIADNLETVEEIGIQGRATFLEAGGETLTLIPCLNDHPLWVQGLTQILRDHTTAARADASA